jgi:hypothetical protein
MNLYTGLNKKEVSKKNSVLKQIKYESRHDNRFSTKLLNDVIATKLLTDNCYLHCAGECNLGYLSELSIDPFGFLIMSCIQVHFIYI